MTSGDLRRSLGAATYTYLFDRDLVGAIDEISGLGIRHVELMAAPPHVIDGVIDPEVARTIRRRVDSDQLVLTSLNPTFLDINLCSINVGMRRESIRQVSNAIRSCGELGIPLIVLFPGRRHVLAPAPFDESRSLLLDSIAALAPVAAEAGVDIGLENGPSNFLDRGDQVASVCLELGDPRVRAVFDLANAHVVDDVESGLRALAPHLALVHVSDTLRTPWAHAPVGSGDVDFAGFATLLDGIGYRGPTIMEIVDQAHPTSGLELSAQALEMLGWSRG